MHIFKVAFYASGAYYALFVEQSLLIPFAAIVIIYLLLSQLYFKGAKDISTRKKIMIATWTDPSEGVITVRVPVRPEKAHKIIQAMPKQNRLTITHFAIKAVGQLLSTLPDLNGKLVFGKFVPYESVDVSCLVDIEGGKDLAAITIKGVDKMSVEDIASFIRQKGSKMKKSSGGEEHKKKTGVARILPAFLVSVVVEVVNFISNKLGLSLKPLGIERHTFGAACVTSVGMLGFEDATAPFTGFANCTIFASINAVIKSPVVEEGEVVVGEVMNCNFVVDHRYVDGGRCKNLVPAFRKVFQNPELFMNKAMKDKN